MKVVQNPKYLVLDTDQYTDNLFFLKDEDDLSTFLVEYFGECSLEDMKDLLKDPSDMIIFDLYEKCEVSVDGSFVLKLNITKK